MEAICERIDEYRPGTTINDVLKKIQTLRTQYGQEVGKIETKCHYTPTIYWFEPLSFLKRYMKKRNIVDSPIMAPIKRDFPDTPKSSNDEFYELEEMRDMPDPSQQPPPKKGRLFKDTKCNESQNEGIFPDQELETIEYTVIEQQSGDPIAPESSKPTSSTQFVEITSQPANIKEYRAKKRAKGLGKFVTTMMSEIHDEKLFLETQQRVLRIIYEAQMKQISP